jgi:hypothetical protein
MREMIESRSLKEERHQAEELTLEELEGQIIELLPDRVELRRRRRRRVIIINNFNTVNCVGNPGILTNTCNIS